MISEDLNNYGWNYILLPEEATEEQLDETEEVVLVILEAALLSESLPENKIDISSLFFEKLIQIL